MDRRRVVKNALVMALGINVSRVLGFVRDIVLAAMLGTTGMIEAFIIAFRVPNIFRSLLGEEAVDSVVVPALAAHAKDDARFSELSSRILLIAAILLGAISVAGVVAAPWLIPVIAPGFKADARKLTFTIEALRIVFPYLFFIGIAAHCAGMAYVKNRYFTASFAPALLNLFMIVGVVVAVKFHLAPVIVLSWAVLGAGAAQCLWQLQSIKRYCVVNPRLGDALSDPEVRHIGKLFVPRLWGVAVYHVNILVVETAFASLSSIVGAGAIGSMYYASRFIQLPLATVSLSVSRAALPGLSGVAKPEEREKFSQAFYFLWTLVLTIIAPISVMFMVFPDAFMGIFRCGAFDAKALALTSWVFVWYAPGLVFYALARVMTSSMYALKDTSTPAKAATVSLVVNIASAAILMFPMKAGGLAAASSVAAAANVAVLIHAMRKRVKVPFTPIIAESARIAFVSVGTAALLYFFKDTMAANHRYVYPALVTVSFTLVFLVLGAMVGITSIRSILERVCAKISKKK
jgi:putative peptidoglycan lipid II flippase